MRKIRLIGGLLALILCCSSCAEGVANVTEPEAEATEQISTAEVTTEEITTEIITTIEETTEEEKPNTVSLDGKAAIFIGNSMIYYGGVVTKGSYRQRDYGWFYQICHANGENVVVYDCTYGNHRLADFTEKGCSTKGCDVGVGGDLLKGIKLDKIDYVFISEAGNNNSNFVRDVENIMARFTNPDTVFVYMDHMYSNYKGHTSITGKLKTLQEKGVLIVDWGKMCYDIYRGRKVPGAVCTYNKNSFANSTDSDSHHPNPLAGYIAAQMCYCAVTGKTAVGQKYDMRFDMQFGAGSTSFNNYKKTYYTSGTSNFDEIMASEADMLGIQQLIDKYLNTYGLGTGNVAPGAEN